MVTQHLQTDLLEIIHPLHFAIHVGVLYSKPTIDHKCLQYFTIHVGVLYSKPTIDHKCLQINQTTAQFTAAEQNINRYLHKIRSFVKYVTRVCNV